MAKKGIAVVLLAVLLSGPVAGAGVGVSVGIGTVGMEFLNRRLEFLAGEAGAPLAPLRLAWEGGLEVWPWPWVGLGMRWLSSLGAILGRERREQRATLASLSAGLRLPELLPGLPVGLSLYAGAGWAALGGVVEGGGLGILVGGAVTWRLVGAGPVSLTAGGGFRYAPVPRVRDGRGNPIETRGLPAADFSGLFLSLSLRWR